MVKCPHCGASNWNKKGTDRKGRQRLFCKNCQRSFQAPDNLPDDIPPVTIVHYSLSDEMCNAAKRSLNPIFSPNLEDVTCRLCLAKERKEHDPLKLTKNKSFSLTGEAIAILEAESEQSGLSQSKWLNKLILDSFK
jgi:hypothetical protein